MEEQDNAASTRLTSLEVELAGALRVVMEWIENWNPNFADDPEWPTDRRAAAAALAKAQGSQP
jgi:hypothetical protein